MAAPAMRKVKLKEVCDRITVGHVGPMADKYTPEGIPFLRSQNIAPFRLNTEDIKYVPREFHEELRKSALRPGDVAVVRTGYPGTACVIPDTFNELNCADLVVITPSSELNPHYLAAIFNSAWGRASVAGNLVGVAQQHFNVGAAKELEVGLPPRPTQDRIAGILSAYDELIENSQRRIKILEAIARALYREWFVHFRFPGHDSVPRVPSPLGEIPKGWEVERLDRICRSIQDGDWIETKDQGGEDFRLLQISNVGVGEFIETGNYRYVTQETFDRLRCNEIVADDLLVARMPNPIGRAWLATKMPWRMIAAVDVAIIRVDRAVVQPLFLVQAWNETANLRRIAAQASGTTRLRITRRELSAMVFVIPTLGVQQQFAEVVQPQRAMIAALRQQIQSLRRIRDLLLPRLLSGQVELAPSNGKETTL